LTKWVTWRVTYKKQEHGGCLIRGNMEGVL
jgi:hypothetical protein